MGTCDDNDTMLQRSDQLLLTPENDHFEGSMLLKAKEGTNTRLGEGGVIFWGQKISSLFGPPKGLFGPPKGPPSHPSPSLVFEVLE